MQSDEMLRLAVLQQRVFRCIEDELRDDGHHKSYEGAWDVTFSLPNFFERDKRPELTVTLHCYVIALNGRHHTWTGDTLAEAIAKAEHELGKVCYEYEYKRFAAHMLECVDEDGESSGDVVIYGDSRPSEQPPC